MITLIIIGSITILLASTMLFIGYSIGRDVEATKNTMAKLKESPLVNPGRVTRDNDIMRDDFTPYKYTYVEFPVEHEKLEHEYNDLEAELAAAQRLQATLNEAMSTHLSRLARLAAKKKEEYVEALNKK